MVVVEFLVAVPDAGCGEALGEDARARAMIGPAARRPSGSPRIASIRSPVTRPRMSTLDERSITAARGVRQKLWTNPAKKSSASPTPMDRVWPKRRMATNQAAPLQSMTRPARSGMRLALTTKALVQSVKRNPGRFPPDFMFSFQNRRLQVNVEIMRAFVRLRDLIGHNREMSKRLDDLESRYDRQFKAVFDAIREMMVPAAPAPKRRIGFVRRE